MPLTPHAKLSQTQGFMQGTAIFSRCRTFRYRLERQIGEEEKTLAIIMVNPSTANAFQNDPTIRRCIGIAAADGYGKLVVGNLFAFCATNIAALGSAADPVGPENDRHLGMILDEAREVVVAWGHLNKLPRPLRGRWQQVLAMARQRGIELHCLDKLRNGEPRHPLFARTPVTLQPWP